MNYWCSLVLLLRFARSRRARRYARYREGGKVYECMEAVGQSTGKGVGELGVGVNVYMSGKNSYVA